MTDWSFVDRNLKPVRLIGTVVGDGISYLTTTIPPQPHTEGDAGCQCDDCQLAREVREHHLAGRVFAYRVKGDEP